MLVLSSPSGAGKTSICKKVISLDRKISLSVSYTTRPKRKSEKEGKDYFFVSKNPEIVSKIPFSFYRHKK